MSDNENTHEIQPIPNRTAWQDWVKELHRPDSRFLSGHYIRPESPLVTKVKQVTLAEVVAEVPGYLIERHLNQQRTR